MRIGDCELQPFDRMAEVKDDRRGGQDQNTDIVQELNLPPVKIHCSVLAEDAIKAAGTDYKEKSLVSS